MFVVWFDLIVYTQATGTTQDFLIINKCSEYFHRPNLTVFSLAHILIIHLSVLCWFKSVYYNIFPFCHLLLVYCGVWNWQCLLPSVIVCAVWVILCNFNNFFRTNFSIMIILIWTCINVHNANECAVHRKRTDHV